MCAALPGKVRNAAQELGEFKGHEASQCSLFQIYIASNVKELSKVIFQFHMQHALATFHFLHQDLKKTLKKKHSWLNGLTEK